MTPPLPAAQYLRRKPPKKVKWYWYVFNALCWLWLFGGINMFLLRDIPLLLFLLGVGVALHPTVILTSRGQPRTWKKHLWVLGGLAWYCFVLAVAFVLLLFVIPPFAILPQTTYLTKPRATEFYGIDYHAFIEQQTDPGVPPEENGFRLLTETFGRPFFSVQDRDKQKFTDAHWHRLCQYLDLPTDIEPKLMFTAWQTYEKTLTPEEQEIVKTSWEEGILPWSEEAVPIVRQWLDENSTAFDVFDAAVQKSVLYIPQMFGGIASTLYLNEEMYRRLTGNLWIRTRYRLAVGEIDKAWDDVLVQYHFAEQRRRAVWNQMSSYGTELGANRYAEGVLLHSDWSSDEILRRAEEIAPFQRPVSEDELRVRLHIERLTILDFWQALADGRYSLEQDARLECCDGSAQGLTFMQRSMLRLMRPGYVMVKINQRFDELERQAFDHAPIPDKKEQDSSLWKTLKMIAWHGCLGSAQEMAGEFSMLFPYEVKTIREMTKHQHTAIASTRLMFALEAYHRDNANLNGGSYPDTLDDLLGQYIDEIPLDPFSGKPFRYILEPPGFLLYSVGPNGIDEDGRDRSDTPKGDDLRRRLPLHSMLLSKEKTKNATP